VIFNLTSPCHREQAVMDIVHSTNFETSRMAFLWEVIIRFGIFSLVFINFISVQADLSIHRELG
jgi:hypothetical protein